MSPPPFSFLDSLCVAQRKTAIPYSAIRWLLGFVSHINISTCPSFTVIKEAVSRNLFWQALWHLFPSSVQDPKDPVQCRKMQLKMTPVSPLWVQKFILMAVTYPAVAAALACFLHTEHWLGGWFIAAPGCGGHSTSKPSVIISVELDRSPMCFSDAVGGALTFWEKQTNKQTSM